MSGVACPFCNKGSDEFFLNTPNFGVIYNISPILPGHSLVIPKIHIESLFDLSDEWLAEFMSLGRKTAGLLSDVFSTDAFDWVVQEKEAAGQSITHLHMHVVPRKIGDLVDPGDWYQELDKRSGAELDVHNRYRLNDQQMAEIIMKLKKAAKTL